MDELARRLGGALATHERFATATVRAGDLELDLAATRAEAYARPGALPEIRPGAARGGSRPPRLHRQRDGRSARASDPS